MYERTVTSLLKHCYHLRIYGYVDVKSILACKSCSSIGYNVWLAFINIKLCSCLRNVGMNRHSVP
jgi:hypothetical protein